MVHRVKAWLSRQSLDDETKTKIDQLEKIIGTYILNPNLYLKALRHRSKLIESNLRHTESYEQLEFLGDAVLDLIISEILFDRFSTRDEGFMTQIRSRIVKGETLAQFSQHLELDKIIEVGSRVKDQGIETSLSVLADIFEALLGALYRDRGYGEARRFVVNLVDSYLDLEKLESEKDNYKSILLEYAQSKKMAAPTYEILRISGPDHEKEFEIQVVINDTRYGKGEGRNKKKAEQIAAKSTLSILKFDFTSKS
jgi:ribonuclease III